MPGSSRVRSLVLATGLLALGSALAVLAWACLRSTDRSTEATPVEWSELKREIRRRFPGAPQITSGELADRLGPAGEGAEPGRGEAADRPPLLLDARDADEYAVSHLPGAVSAPDVESALEAIRESGDGRAVVVYCSVGWRSSDLVEKLRERGVDEVRNLEGSIFQWANEGRPVVRDGREVRQVHPYDESWGRFLDPGLRAWEPTTPPGSGTEKGDGP